MSSPGHVVRFARFLRPGGTLLRGWLLRRDVGRVSRNGRGHKGLRRAGNDGLRQGMALLLRHSVRGREMSAGVTR
jgi:hypothetical protein